MPYDRRAYEEDETSSEREPDRHRKFREFDCPECSANNPFDEGFGNGDEVLCAYCGEEFKADVNDDGRLRLKPT